MSAAISRPLRFGSYNSPHISLPGQPRSSSTLPLQQPVSSASVLPAPPSRLNPATALDTPTMSLQLTSNQYIEHSRKLMEHQRQLHEEERALWDLERKQLHLKVQELEDMVHRLGGQVNPSAVSPNNQLGVSVPGIGPHPAPPNILNVVTEPIGQNATQITDSTGDEFWRGAGGKSDAHPTRSFSESSESLQKTPSGNRLPSISEDHNTRRKSVGFVGIEPELAPAPLNDFFTHPIPGYKAQGLSSIPGDRISANLDGISFKPSTLVTKAVSSNSATPSPLGTPSSHVASSSVATSAPPSVVPKPVLLDIPSLGLTEEDLLKKDAGHTPLAKLADSESLNSSQDTPVLKVFNKEQQITDPAPSRLRQPRERSDSYFPVLEDREPRTVPGDPALDGPLGLKGDPTDEANHQFLSQLNSKLILAQRSASVDENLGKSQDAELKTTRNAEDKPHSRDEPTLNNEEPEPTLRIKKSTNFGSVFGASTLGQDV